MRISLFLAFALSIMFLMLTYLHVIISSVFIFTSEVLIRCWDTVLLGVSPHTNCLLIEALYFSHIIM